MSRLLPTRSEWRTLFDALTRNEKIAFLVFLIIAWASVNLLLVRVDRDLSKETPANGGSVTEGIVGIPRFINPLLALSDVDRDLARIIYAGLVKPDGNGGFLPELAERFEISEDGLTYTFWLREGLRWHDGETLTTKDIAFTVDLAKNPAIRSHRLAHWEGVDTEIKNDREIVFRLKRPYAPFLGNTTMGILPHHLWHEIEPEAFPLSALNAQPVGAGPFYVDEVTKDGRGVITAFNLKRFKGYLPRPPYLDTMVFYFYPTEAALREAFEDSAVDTASIDHTWQIPSESTVHEMSLPRVVGLFFNQDTYTPLHDPVLREALDRATDRDRIVREILGERATATSLPIPPGTFAHASTLERTAQDIEGAKEILAKAKYEDTDGDGIIEKLEGKKDRVKISFTITTIQTPELVRTAELLRDMWREIGVEVNVQAYEKGDLDQNFIRPRNYDALLYGLVMGYDVDPLGFWHARQIKHPGSNIALYANTKVDKLLEDAQNTTSNEKRKELYTLFQEEISKDRPALFLYSPRYLYATHKDLGGIGAGTIPFPQERFSTIDAWYTQTKSVWNIFAGDFSNPLAILTKK
ncbi:MAG: ABC transporter substrate-binding protein [Patescibacteria group bacterium]